MNILVTGAQGRLGSHLVQKLLQEGHQVRGTDLQPVSTNQHERYEYVPGDLLDSQHTGKIVQDMDAVIHLAGLILYDDAQSRRIMNVNWLATFEVLEAMAHTGKPYHRFIYGSSGQVYPDNPDGAYLYNPIDENHPQRPMNYYGYAKQASEALVRFYQRKWNIPGVSLRFTHIQYPHELINPDSEWSGARFYLNRRLASFQNMKNKSPQIEESIRILQEAATDDEQLLLTCGMDGRAFELVISHPDDIVQGILLTLEADAAIGEAYNLGYFASFNFGTMIPYMAEKMNMPYVKLNLPLLPYHGIASIEKIRIQLGYKPQYDPFRMIDEAIEQRQQQAVR